MIAVEEDFFKVCYLCSIKFSEFIPKIYSFLRWKFFFMKLNSL